MSARTHKRLLKVAALLLIASPAAAQTYSVPVHVIAGGGGTSSSVGGYTLNGTIGFVCQPDFAKP